MKIYFKGNKYRRWDGVVIEGPGEVEVEKALGEYLVNTFPNLFSRVQVAAKEKNLKRATKNAGKRK